METSNGLNCGCGLINTIIGQTRVSPPSCVYSKFSSCCSTVDSAHACATGKHKAGLLKVEKSQILPLNTHCFLEVLCHAQYQFFNRPSMTLKVVNALVTEAAGCNSYIIMCIGASTMIFPLRFNVRGTSFSTTLIC
jgi:hypothetical protein